MHFIRARIRRYHRLCNLRDHLKRAGYGDLKNRWRKAVQMDTTSGYVTLERAAKVHGL